ncbi:hypothetical protein RQN30_07200 [Arcanobacterium hippocoleae]
MTLIRTAVALIFCVFSLFTVLPELTGQTELLLAFPLAQLISFRWILALFFLFFGLLYLIPAFRAHTVFRRFVAGLSAIVLLVSGAAHLTTVFRGEFILPTSLRKALLWKKQKLRESMCLPITRKAGQPPLLILRK